MYGRGTSDMKDSVAVSIKTLEYVIENNLPLKYGTLIVSDEETGGQNGAKHWAEDIKLKTKVLLDGDAGLLINKIIQKSKGIAGIKLVCHGKTAHGSRPWLGIDANENLINTIVNLRKIFPYYSMENHSSENEWNETMHVGTMQGGIARNAICDLAEATLDIRFTEKYNADKILQIVKENVVGDTEVSLIGSGRVVYSDENNKYFQAYKKSVEKITGKEAILGFVTGTSDSEYFYNDIEKIRFILGERDEITTTNAFFIKDEDATDAYNRYDGDNNDVNFFKLNIKGMDTAERSDSAAKNFIAHITR